MQLVGARFADDVDHCARVAADVGAIEVGLDLELPDRVYTGGRRVTERVRRSLLSTPS